MINYHCPNCKRTTEKQNKRVLILCGCGYEMLFYSPCCYTQGRAIKTPSHSSLIVTSFNGGLTTPPFIVLSGNRNIGAGGVIVVKNPPFILNRFYLNSCVCSKLQNEKRVYFNKTLLVK